MAGILDNTGVRVYNRKTGRMHNMDNKKTGNVMALIPVGVFLILYLGTGVYFEYISPGKDRMGFYVISVVVAFSIALVVAFLQNRKKTFEEKIHLCAQGIGDDNIVIMLFIFLMAGAFSGIASKAQGAVSTANLLLSIIPPGFALPGIFIIACLISMAMGTSVGTITVLVPIAEEISRNGNYLLPLCVGTVVGGAMFGDNLSFISDTTIAATKTQGVEMKDKFRTNLRVALPAAVLTLIILIIMSFAGKSVNVGNFEYNIFQALPYFIVLILAMLGINVFLVLGLGIILFAIIGAATGTLNYETLFIAMGDGTSGMFETMIVAILVASIGSLVRENGGFEAILNLIEKHFSGKRGGTWGIVILTVLVDIATANNTIAIVMAAPVAKDITEKYGIDPKKTASLLDTSSCIAQGIIPYGAQLLVAASICGIASINIIPFLFYPFLLAVFTVISIIKD